MFQGETARCGENPGMNRRNGAQVGLSAMAVAKTWPHDLNSTQNKMKSISSNHHFSLVRISQAFQPCSLLWHGPLSCR